MYISRLSLYHHLHTLFTAHVPLFYTFRVQCFDKLSCFISSEESLSLEIPLSSISLRWINPPWPSLAVIKK